MSQITLDAGLEGLGDFPQGFSVLGRDDLGDVLAVDADGAVWCGHSHRSRGLAQGIRPRREVRTRKPPCQPARYTAPAGLPMESNLIHRDPEIMSGALCFAGTRVPVQNLFDYLEGNSSLEDFLEDFPSVQRQVAVAVLEAAKKRLFDDAPAA